MNRDVMSYIDKYMNECYLLIYRKFDDPAQRNMHTSVYWKIGDLFLKIRDFLTKDWNSSENSTNQILENLKEQFKHIDTSLCRFGNGSYLFEIRKLRIQ